MVKGSRSRFLLRLLMVAANKRGSRYLRAAAFVASRVGSPKQDITAFFRILNGSGFRKTPETVDMKSWTFPSTETALPLQSKILNRIIQGQ